MYVCMSLKVRGDNILLSVQGDETYTSMSTCLDEMWSYLAMCQLRFVASLKMMLRYPLSVRFRFRIRNSSFSVVMKTMSAQDGPNNRMVCLILTCTWQVRSLMFAEYAMVMVENYNEIGIRPVVNHDSTRV